MKSVSIEESNTCCETVEQDAVHISENHIGGTIVSPQTHTLVHYTCICAQMLAKLIRGHIAPYSKRGMRYGQMGANTKLKT